MNVKEKRSWCFPRKLNFTLGRLRLPNRSPFLLPSTRRCRVHFMGTFHGHTSWAIVLYRLFFTIWTMI